MYFLLGFLLLALTVFIHFFSFKRARTFYFSNIWALRSLKKEAQAYRRIKRALILCLRLLALLFLWFAFSEKNPFAGEGEKQDVKVLIAIDNAQRLENATRAGQTGLERAIESAKRIVNQHDADVSYTLLTHNYSSFQPMNRERTLEKLVAIGYSYASSLPAIIDRIHTNLIHTHDATHIYLISDYQDIRTQRPSVSYKQDTLHQWHMIPIGYAAHENIFVDTVYASTPFVSLGITDRLFAKIRNAGSTNRYQTVVKFLLNGQIFSFQRVDIPANSAETISVALPVLLEHNKGSIIIEDPSVHFDNTFYFSLNLSPPIRILAIEGESPTPYVEKLYADNPIFSYSAYRAAEVDYADVLLADCIILNQLTALTPALATTLTRHLQAGKNALMIPAKEPSIDTYQSIVKSLSLRPKGEKPKTLSPPSYKNPFFSNLFEREEGRIKMPFAQPVMDFDVPQSSVLLSFEDNMSFYVKIPVYKGNFYAWGAPLEEEYTDIMTHDIFLPLSYKAILSSAKKEVLYHRIDDMRIPVSGAQGATRFTLSNNLHTVFPKLRKLAHAWWLMPDTRLLQPDHYSLKRIESEDTLRSFLSVNHALEQSMYDSISHKNINNYFTHIQDFAIIDPESDQQASPLHQAWHEKKHMSKLLLGVALAVLLAEMIALKYAKP